MGRGISVIDLRPWSAACEVKGRSQQVVDAMGSMARQCLSLDGMDDGCSTNGIIGTP